MKLYVSVDGQALSHHQYNLNSKSLINTLTRGVRTTRLTLIKMAPFIKQENPIKLKQRNLCFATALVQVNKPRGANADAKECMHPFRAG